MNRWTDQPATAEGVELFHQFLLAGFALQIQKTPTGTFSCTAGNLFKSETNFYESLEELLRDVNQLLNINRRR